APRLRLALQLAELLDDGTLLVVEPATAFRGERLQRLGVGQPLALACQLGQFARAQGRLVQLLALEAEQRQLALAVLALGRQGSVPAAQLAHTLRRFQVIMPQLMELAVGVQQFQLIGGLQERLALALAVNIDEDAAQLAQRADRDGLIVDVGITAAGAAQTAGQGHLAVIEIGLNDLLDLVAGDRAGGGEAAGGGADLGARGGELLGGGARRAAGRALPGAGSCPPRSRRSRRRSPPAARRGRPR